MEKHVDFMTLLSLQDHKLVNTNQYLIACSIISAARTKLSIMPAWSGELEQLTGLQHSHFCNIEKRLRQKFDASSDKIAKLQETEKRAKKKSPVIPKEATISNDGPNLNVNLNHVELNG